MSVQVMPQALDPSQARALENGSQLLQAGRAHEAVEVAQRLVAHAAMAPDAHHLLALCHAEAGNEDAAEKAFLRALELAPGHPMILVNYAVMLRKAARLEPALVALRQATESMPGFAKAWSELGTTALRAGHHQRALQAFRQAVQLEPGSARNWHALGSAARATGDLDAAQAALREATVLEPDSAASLELGAVQRLSGRADQAVACFDRIRKRGDHSPELADALVGALIDDGRFADAEQLARHVVREHPDFVAGRVTLANLLWEYGASAAIDDDPFDLFRAALQQAPDHHALRYAFIQLLLSARLADEALDQIAQLRARADDPILAWKQANALEMLGRTNQAGALYAQLHADWGQHTPAFLNSHVRHLLTAGKWDIAAEVASRATLLEPDNQEAWANLATAWRLLDDPREHWLCDYDRLVGFIEVETPPGFASQVDFLEALTANLDQRHNARREPIQQSLRGGSQTPGRLFGRLDPLLAATKVAMLRGVEHWLSSLPTDASHPFLMRKTPSVRISGSWSVKLWSSGNHVNHIHPEGWISSAFYVALPPSMRTSSASDEAGCIQFGQPPMELKLGLPPRRVIRPEPGKLALFPSYLWHGTVPFEDEQPRITIAFDMTPLEPAV
ncbi:MAG: tetratricopeptide repeat protein [Thermomonas sp.]